MISISYYEARTHFSELLDQVARGKKILITRRGRPAAMLSPPPEEKMKNVLEVIGAMKALRRQNKLGKGVTIRDLIDQGRRF
jgi:prevent-host-death family protein